MTLGNYGNFWELMANIATVDYFVYTIELDGKVIYVGQTKDIMGRLRQYKCVFQKKKCHNPKLQELFDSGDVQRATFRVVAMAASYKEVLEIEDDFIERYRDTCLNKYDTFSESTRKKISVASQKMWKNPTIRKDIVRGISKRHTLTSPDGSSYEFSNSYEVKKFLDKMNGNLHQNDRKRVGYQMLESCGENKGWKLSIEGKRLPSKWLCGLLKTPPDEILHMSGMIPINGKSELVKLNRERKFRININRLLREGKWNGFEFFPTIEKYA